MFDVCQAKCNTLGSCGSEKNLTQGLDGARRANIGGLRPRGAFDPASSVNRVYLLFPPLKSGQK